MILNIMITQNVTYIKIGGAFGLNCYASEELQTNVLMTLKKSELQLFIGYVNMID